MKAADGNTRRRSGEIMEAAARVFAERGYHGASTQDIADLLGIRQASLYYYFPSKEVALEHVCMQGVAGFFETEQAIAAGPGTPREKLAGLIRAHIAPLLDRSHFVRVFLTQRQFLPNPSRRRIGKFSRAIEAIFESVIRAGHPQGRVSRRRRSAPFRAGDPRHVQLGRRLVRQGKRLDRAHRRRICRTGAAGPRRAGAQGSPALTY